ncbi:hypothetical protein G5T42_11700 [Microbacterium sp. 4R-513]|uniref:hypothetical protein n=1 Tax=Microbacterium sp. 4R-513 TaxID=2567934 RepID=UPI0013E158AA|nr:hypothetical protein [Microbacterium sp. 4R-513]QIG40063.1 hypothetical protein G5T42_11700 [Microbacterium sp. 4R-513]
MASDKADVLTQDEGSQVAFQLKAGAIDLRKDGGSVWRPKVLDAARVETASIFVGEYVGLAESTRDEVEQCEISKMGCVPEKPFEVRPDPYPPTQPREPKFAAHALIVFNPTQMIGRGPAETRVAQCFRVVTLGSVPSALADEV